MAPEQAVPKPVPATTAVDVYGLGAILYFLLTGHAPFAGESLLETLMLVREGSVVAPRKSVPAIDRDLEMICLMAMDREPSRRYAAADAMADDLDRYGRGEPVHARPLPWHAQWGRRMKRHPVVTAIVSTVLLATAVLLGMGTYYTVQQSRLTRTLIDKTAEAEAFSQSAAQLEAEAEAIRDEALTARGDHRELLYAAHIRQAGDGLKTGDIRHVDDVLNRQIAEPGLADRRGFEWFWLRRQSSVSPPLHEVTLHNPRCLQYSPEGTRLAVGDSEGRCFLMDAATMQVRRLWTTPHEMGLESVSFSPSSALVATAGHDTSVCVWDTSDGSLVCSLAVPTGVSWQAQFLDDERLVAWCRGGKVILLKIAEPNGEWELTTNVGDVWDVAVCGQRQMIAVLGRHSVKLFDAGTLDELSALALLPHVEFARNIRFFNSGQRLIFDDGGRQITVHKVGENGSLTLERWMDFPDEVREFDVSPDGSRVVACGPLGSVFVSSMNAAAEPFTGTTEITAKWQAHQDRINGVAFSPSGNEIVTLSRDHMLRVWQPATEPSVRVLVPETEPKIYDSALAASALGEYLAAAGANGIRLWELKSQTQLALIGSAGSGQSSVAVSRSGRLVAGATPRDSAVVEVWDVGSRPSSPEAGDDVRPVPELLWRRAGQMCDHLEFAPDERLLAVVDHQNDRVLILNASNGQTVRELPVESVWAARFSPDGSRLAVTTLDSAQVWNCETWQPTHHLTGHVRSVTTIAYSTDGARIATGGQDRSVRIYDSHTGAELWRMLGHRDWVEDLAFAPDGRSLVSASRDGTIKVWQVSTGEFLCDLYKPANNRPWRLQFCGDGKIAVRTERGQILLLNCSRDK